MDQSGWTRACQCLLPLARVPLHEEENTTNLLETVDGVQLLQAKYLNDDLLMIMTNSEAEIRKKSQAIEEGIIVFLGLKQVSVELTSADDIQFANTNNQPEGLGVTARRLLQVSNVTKTQLVRVLNRNSAASVLIVYLPIGGFVFVITCLIQWYWNMQYPDNNNASASIDYGWIGGYDLHTS